MSDIPLIIRRPGTTVPEDAQAMWFHYEIRTDSSYICFVQGNETVCRLLAPPVLSVGDDSQEVIQTGHISQKEAEHGKSA